MRDKNGCSLDNLNAMYVNYFKSVKGVHNWTCRACEDEVDCNERVMTRHYKTEHDMTLKWGKHQK